MTRKTLAQKLESHRTLIFNSGNPEIAPALEIMGIDNPYIDKIKIIYKDVLQLNEKQQKEYQEQKQSYDKFYEEKEECMNNLRRIRKVVKLVSRKDKELQSRLNINLELNCSIEEWINNTAAFYSAVQNEPELLKSLARFKVTSEQVADEKKAVEKLRALRNASMTEKGQAQEATRIRDKKIEELDDACYELKTISKIALEDQPQLLEELGIVV